MTQKEKENKKLHDLEGEMQEELNEIEENQEDENIQEIEEEEIEEIKGNDELSKLKDAFARQQADYDNFKKRVERDRDDMMFFLKSDILKKVLPRLDDMQRIILATPETDRNGAIYEGIVSIEKKLSADLDKMGVKAFVSKGEKVDPDKHEVMTQVPCEEGVIVDEFEKGYMIGDRVLRIAKVVVGQ